MHDNAGIDSSSEPGFAALNANSRRLNHAFVHALLARGDALRSKSVPLAIVLALCLLVSLRSAVFLVWTGAHFDSDQAVFGLMTNDLLAGRAIPTFAYGRRYMLAVSVWLAAPLFAVFGASVGALKFPMYVLNLALVGLSWLGLRRDRLSIPGTVFAILPFAVPGVVTTSRLLEHAGGNVEPLAWMVGAYFLRQRPIWLGLWFGVAMLNREFAAIGFIALLCLDGLQGELRRSWRARFLTASVMVGLFMAVFTLAQHFTYWKGPRPEIGSARIDNVRGFFVMQLPSLLGALERPLSAYNITSNLHAGHSVVYLAFFSWIGVVMWQLRRVRVGQLEGFAVYLLLIGGGQALAFLLFVPAPFDSTLLRYILPCLLAVCGLVAFAWRMPELRGVTAAFVLTICGANVWDHVRLLDEYVVRTPQRELQRLAEVLVHANIRYARAGYWVAYDLSFITQQHVLVVPTSDDRIPRFDRILQQHSSEVVTLAEHSCPVGMRAQSQALQWLVCKP